MADGVVIQGGSFQGQTILASVLGNVTYSSSSDGGEPLVGQMSGASAIGVHLALDAMGYRGRDAYGRKLVQERLLGAIGAMLEASGLTIDGVLLQETGDGANVVLPSDFQLENLQTLILALRSHQRRDNATYRDQITLRLAMEIGPMSRGALGFHGQGIIDVSELLNSDALRACAQRPGTLVALGISPTVHRFVVHEGWLSQFAGDLERVEVAHKDGRTESAWITSLT